MLRVWEGCQLGGRETRQWEGLIEACRETPLCRVPAGRGIEIRPSRDKQNYD